MTSPRPSFVCLAHVAFPRQSELTGFKMVSVEIRSTYFDGANPSVHHIRGRYDIGPSVNVGPKKETCLGLILVSPSQIFAYFARAASCFKVRLISINPSSLSDQIFNVCDQIYSFNLVTKSTNLVTPFSTPQCP